MPVFGAFRRGLKGVNNRKLLHEHEYGSYDPIFPGYEKVGKSVFQNFQDRTESENSPSNISRILENVADFNLKYFRAGNNYF